MNGAPGNSASQKMPRNAWLHWLALAGVVSLKFIPSISYSCGARSHHSQQVYFEPALKDAANYRDRTLAGRSRMSMKQLVLRTVLTALAIASPLCAFAQKASLCTEQEDFLFTCTLESKKIVSVCAEVDEAQNGYKSIVYRYGAKDAVELSVPKALADFRTAIRVSEWTNKRSSKLTEDDRYLRFLNGRYSYLTYTSTGNTFDIAGLAVFEGAKLLKKEKCQPDSFDSPMLSFNEFLNLGVREEEAAGEKGFWKAIAPPGSAVLRHPSEMRSK
jgi:hypothetical protein